MGEAVMWHGQSIQSVTNGKATIRLNTYTDRTTVVTLKCGTRIIKKSASGELDVNVYFGDWEVSATVDGRNLVKLIKVDDYKVYKCVLKGRTYGVSIDMTNSDPTDAVTYIDDAEGLEPMMFNRNTETFENYDETWKDMVTDFLGVRPCLMNDDGSIITYLNPDNYGEDTNGNTVDIDLYDGKSDRAKNIGNVMIEFKKMWYKYGISDDGNTLTFQVSDYDRSEDGFVQHAFYPCTISDSTFTGYDSQFEDSPSDHFYYSAYINIPSYTLTGDTNNDSRFFSRYYDKTSANNYRYGTKSFNTYKSNTPSFLKFRNYLINSYICGLAMILCKSRDIRTKFINPKLINKSDLIACASKTSGLFSGKSDSTEISLYNNTYTFFGISTYFDQSLSIGIRSTGESYYSDSQKTTKVESQPVYYNPNPLSQDFTMSQSEYESIFGTAEYEELGRYAYESSYSSAVLKMKPICDGAAIFPSLVQYDDTKGFASHHYMAKMYKTTNNPVVLDHEWYYIYPEAFGYTGGRMNSSNTGGPNIYPGVVPARFVSFG